ncbi:MAG TPA: NrfD/PsrC family molybdoenzyme membrane anchor subunit [Methylomirabilota bacterium]|nr:NrfD/PsrC family molybdoenzyme membrane anchor subunit [Methylomirabilota bacterium]
MSSTFFTASPEWRWFIVAYFFLGGLAGGSYFLATLMDRVGPEQDRPLVRLGYLVAFPLVCVCGFVLTVDLGRPERFWHMLVQSQTFRPMLKTFSPMSTGAWVLLLFSGCAFVSFAGTLAERGWPDWAILRLGSPAAPGGRLVTGVGAILGLYLAGYTGVLISVTNRPIWADTTLLGLTFLSSATSTSAALLILLGAWMGLSRDRLHRLERFDRSALILEAGAIVGLVASLGRIATVWLDGWGVLLAGVVLGGIAVPLLLDRERRPERRPVWIAPALVLLGGLVLRMVIILSSDRL